VRAHTRLLLIGRAACLRHKWWWARTNTRSSTTIFINPAQFAVSSVVSMEMGDKSRERFIKYRKMNFLLIEKKAIKYNFYFW